MADETPELEVDAQPAQTDETPRARARASSDEAAEGTAAAAPVRARRTGAKPAAEPAAAEAPKPRRTRAAAKGPEEESPVAETPKPKRIRARAPKAGEEAVEAPAQEPAPKPPAPAAKKSPARAEGARRLVRGRGAKDAPPQVQLVHAHARYVRSSARKARIVCDHIRGKSVPEARAILAFAPRGVAKDWAKLLDSAVANAEHNHELIGDELHVKHVFADVGPTLKRFRPRAMGRATPINKRTAHLSITLAPKE
jgi:ribosomal protein L22